MPGRIRIALAAACWIGSAIASSQALAQADCSVVPETMRARCQEAMRVKAACAGLQGDALTACQQKNLQYGNTREDCSKLTGAALTQCEQHNRSMNAASPCSGKAGAELQSCIREQVNKGAMLK